MDVRQYFRKIHEIESSLEDEYPVVVSLDTPDGGKAGMIFEVSRQNAAKMLVENRVTLATEEQKQQLREIQATARKAAEKAELAKRIQLAIISDTELATQVSARANNPKASGK
jgi:hypothetical protein